jgi:CheY-like chemotaxis protein
MKRVLIIEDCPLLLDNLKEILELLDFKVITAENGKEGVRHIQEESLDLILCDIQIPKMNGYKVLKFIKSEDELEDIPFVFLTGFTQKKEIKKGKQAGVDAYLTKPFSLDKLTETINQLLL